MKILNYPSKQADKKIKEIIERRAFLSGGEYESVLKIVEDIKANGDKALLKYSKKFDSPNIKKLKVEDAEFNEAKKKVEKSFIKTIEKVYSNIEKFHKKDMLKSWFMQNEDGVLLGKLANPVEKAAIYVPGAKGGLTPLVSTVLMGGVPAKIAGVKNVFMTTPPQKKGSINPYLLMTAKVVGFDAVYKIGSAWAVSAFAYGTETVPKVDVIAGPGNIFVTIAKKIVFGDVGIDMLAGPSEILIIADEKADPKFIAADMLSQAEHDVLASSILITTSKKLASLVLDELKTRIPKLSKKETAQKSIKNYGAIIVVKDIKKVFEVSNFIAPEHLELQIENPFEKLFMIKNAGAVFMGQYSPEPVGDYIAGTNHILPTNRTARFSSALSVDTFMKKTSIISYSKTALKKDFSDIKNLTTIEGLEAHFKSVEARFEKK